MSYLTKVTALHEFAVNSKYFQKLLEASPNLHHLEISYDFLPPLFDDEFVGLLLNQRITQIYILIPLKTSLESVISSVSHLSSIFSSLKHFYFGLGKGYKSAESLILVVLRSLCKWNSLVSFGVVNAVMSEEILSTNIQQWVLENSSLEDRNSFIVDYTNGIFRLWL